jgi:hypothetical protein
MSQVTLQGNASGTGVFTVAAPNSNTSRTLTLPDATGTVVTTDATQTLTNKSISGAQINSGTVAAARLGSGTPGTGNFLRGDGSWQATPGPTSAQVLNATAGASVGDVGTYAALESPTAVAYTQGATAAGSSLRYARFAAGSGTTAPPGTWRAMGITTSSGTAGTVWLRIS